MSRFLPPFALGLAAALTLSGCASTPAASSLFDPAKPVTITVWHYYNGAQQDAFSALVEDFNATEGAEKGIQVEEFSQGSVTDLKQSVLDAAQHKVGAAELPNIFAAYADTAYEADQMGVVADLSPYLSEEEKALYLDSYLKEGYLAGGDSLKIFPVAKSTEILLMNYTDWLPFAQATGATLDELTTIEGVTQVSRRYFEWTDAETPQVQGDGRAFFGRDAFANYMLIGARQLGCEIFEVSPEGVNLHFEREVARKLWDNYYLPMVAGWFDAENRFRSDDVKVGRILACVGSTSSATFFPEVRVVSDTESYPIEMAALPAPEFEGGQPYAVQQGAGMVVTQGPEQEMAASAEFLKWFTSSQRNTQFSVGSGYLPVTKEASTQSFLSAVMDENQINEKMRNILTVAVKTTEGNTMYTPQAFPGGNDARNLLEESMPAKAAQDRQALLAQVEQGVPYEQALASFTTDENFEGWYQDTLAQLQALVGGQ